MTSDNLPAGRALDALIAEKVMGLTWNEGRCRVCGWPLAPNMGYGCVLGNCSRRPVPLTRADSPAPYSTNITAAWKVVEAMQARGYYAEIGDHISDPTRRCAMFASRAGYYDSYERCWENEHQACADTAPHAICLAALKALEVTP